MRQPAWRRGQEIPQIRERPETFFRLSPAVEGKPQCFAVKRGEIANRLNPAFFGGGNQALLKKLQAMPNARNLGSLISEGAFGVLPKGDSYVESGGIRFLRATELGIDNQIDWESCLRAPAGFARHGRARLKKDDVLVAVKGATIASEKSVCLVDVLDEPTIINGSIFRFQPTSEVSSEFLLEALSTEFVKKQMKGAMILNNAVDYLSRTILDGLILPLPERETVQKKLVGEMKTARLARQRKLAEAEALLAGLDNYLLTQLGLTPPPADNRKVFAVRLGQLKNSGRVNADYFHPERVLAIRTMEKNRAKMRAERLADIADFVRDAVPAETSKNYIGLANVQSNTGELIESGEEAAGGLCFRFAAGDVLFARLRPYLNKVLRAEKSGVCSTEFHVIRLRATSEPEDEIQPDYLATILRSALVLAQTRHMMTGNTHPRLANEDVVNLVVPIPKPKVQETITAEVARRRTVARRLRAEAAAEWSAAKAQFEQKLLGESARP